MLLSLLLLILHKHCFEFLVGRLQYQRKFWPFLNVKMIPRKGFLRHGCLYIGTQEHMAREHKAKETQPCIYASLFPKAILH